MPDAGESIAAEVDTPEPTEEEKKEPCKRIYLHAFRGDRSTEFLVAFKRKIADAKQHGLPGPSEVECLVYTGHVGLSFEADSPILGFNPETGSDPIWLVFDKLKGTADVSKASYPGRITDDTAVFDAAKQRGLTVVKTEYVYPESQYNAIKQQFDQHRAGTSLQYNFPGGSGDCNCATFPAQIGIPVPEATGILKDYIPAMSSGPAKKQMGDCEG